jgi:2-keto-4-pentenoate hydratase
VGARLGVMGEIIPINHEENWQERLSNIQVIILDQNNNQLATGDSKALLGNPLEVVLWLKNNLQTQGINLQPGDLISLGTITPLIPVSSGLQIKAQYLGLPEDKTVEISVKFK